MPNRSEIQWGSGPKVTQDIEIQDALDEAVRSWLDGQTGRTGRRRPAFG